MIDKKESCFLPPDTEMRAHMLGDARRLRVAKLAQLTRTRWAFDKDPCEATLAKLQLVTMCVMSLEEFIVNPTVEGLQHLGITGVPTKEGVS